MTDRTRYDSAMFWLAFGTAAAVIGLALMTIGVTRSAAGANLLVSLWFDGGLGLLVTGGLMLFWALVLYLAHRRREIGGGAPAGAKLAVPSVDAETIRGYYAERKTMIDLWEKLHMASQPKNLRN